jgi:hypothetical protein
MILFCFLSEGLNTRFDKANNRICVEKIVFRVFPEKTSYRLTDIRSVLKIDEEVDPDKRFR